MPIAQHEIQTFLFGSALMGAIFYIMPRGSGRGNIFTGTIRAARIDHISGHELRRCFAIYDPIDSGCDPRLQLEGVENPMLLALLGRADFAPIMLGRVIGGEESNGNL